MSGTAIKWVRKQNFGSAPLKSVVNALALRVDKSGTAWAAQSLLAQDIGMTERHLRSCLRVLEAIGVITRQRRSKGRYGRASDLITIALHRQFNVTPKDLAAVRKRLAEESSNRNNLSFPTGTRVPGIIRGKTYPLIQGGGATYQGKALGTEVGSKPRPALAVVNGSWIPSAEDGL